MKNSIRVFAPASVSNVGSGYDIMGFAFDGPGDIIETHLNDSGKISVENLSGADIPLDSTNVVYPALEKLRKSYKKKFGVHLKFLKKINPGSGIGSSAASSAGAVFSVNHLLNDPFSQIDLIEFAMEGEKLVNGEAVADNVAPCILGGFNLIRSYKPLDIIQIPYPETLVCTVVHPDIVIKTYDSRKVIKKEISVRNAVAQSGNASALIAGLMSGNLDLIGRSVNDVIAEPYRKKLIPGYARARKAAIDNGALAFNISGSGPSVFAFSKDAESGDRIARHICSAFQSEGIKSLSYTSRISSKGVRLIN